MTLQTPAPPTVTLASSRKGSLESQISAEERRRLQESIQEFTAQVTPAAAEFDVDISDLLTLTRYSSSSSRELDGAQPYNLLRGDGTPMLASLVMATLNATGGVVQRLVRSGTTTGVSEELKRLVGFTKDLQGSLSHAKFVLKGSKESIANALPCKTVSVHSGSRKQCEQHSELDWRAPTDCGYKYALPCTACASAKTPGCGGGATSTSLTGPCTERQVCAIYS